MSLDASEAEPPPGATAASPAGDASALRETALYAPVKRFLEAQGYAVKGEVRGCDVVATRGDEPPVVVELKTAFSLALILQGVQRLTITDAVYIAFPAATAGALWRSKRREATALCRRLGLGALVVHVERDLVEPALDPAPYAPRKNARRLGLLLREFERRRGDPTPGGGRGAVMTAYRQDALLCARALAEAGGAASPKAVKAATGVAAAGRILSRDVYGWFVRLERGVYGLSERGRAALAGRAPGL